MVTNASDTIRRLIDQTAAKTVRITSIDFTDYTIPDGLGAIKMDRLGSMVVLAGRNGSGKSRLLSRLLRWSQNYRIPEQQESSEVTTILKKGGTLKVVGLRVPAANNSGVMVNFMPKAQAMQSPSSRTKQHLISDFQSIRALNASMAEHGLGAIQQTQDRWRDATHQVQMSTIDANAQADITKQYSDLCTLIKTFLNVEISRNHDNESTIFGFPLGEAKLSDGQNVILQFCLALHGQNEKLRNPIILLDEPENHLHPAALIDFVQALKEYNKNGQIWIATHSIPLLAEVDSNSIWWMENGTVMKAGHQPEAVLMGLLGNEERRDKLALFLDLPNALASNRYAVECLVAPQVTPFHGLDPQLLQIREILEASYASGPLRLLDFGAGKGRLASELAHQSPDFLARLEYRAFDPNEANKQACVDAIAHLHEDAAERHYMTHRKLRDAIPDGTLQCVIMCNVLHEIPPENWGELFGPAGLVTQLLSPEGALLLVEVQELPHGELAHAGGFLVFDTPQLRKMFPSSDEIKFASQRDGWLKAHLIPKPLLARYTPETKRAALDDLKATAEREIRRLRSGSSSYRQGRLHGFWTQQFANAALALAQ